LIEQLNVRTQQQVVKAERHETVSLSCTIN